MIVLLGGNGWEHEQPQPNGGEPASLLFFIMAFAIFIAVVSLVAFILHKNGFLQ